MTSPPALYSHIATFLLPPGARAGHGLALADSAQRCLIEVGKIGLVTIMGRSRDAVFAEAARILNTCCGHLPPLSIACTVYTATPAPADDGRDWLRLPGPADAWSIAVNAEVAFAPTGMGHEIPDLKREARPQLSVVKLDR